MKSWLVASWFLLLNLESWIGFLMLDLEVLNQYWINHLGFWHHHNCLVHHHEACFYNLPFFDNDKPEIKKRIQALSSNRSLTKFSPFFFKFKLHLKLRYLIIWVLDLILTFSPPLASTKSQSAYRDIKSYTNS